MFNSLKGTDIASARAHFEKRDDELVKVEPLLKIVGD
jgi:hypothetical protein